MVSIVHNRFLRIHISTGGSMLAERLVRRPSLQKEGETNARSFLCVISFLYAEPIVLDALLKKES